MDELRWSDLGFPREEPAGRARARVAERERDQRPGGDPPPWHEHPSGPLPFTPYPAGPRPRGGRLAGPPPFEPGRSWQDGPVPRPRAAAQPPYPGRVVAGRRMERHRQRATWQENLVTGLLGLLMVAGLLLDGWSHANPPGTSLGPFLTPWHALLYAGFAATALWILTRHQVRGRWSLAAVPPGYAPALVGIGLALVALAGDALWRAAAGEGEGVTRLLSPFQLLLLAGAGLLVTSGLRAAWAAPTPARVPTLTGFAPVLLSVTLATTMVASSLQYASPLVAWERPQQWQVAPGSPFFEVLQVYDLLSVLVTNLILIAPVLLILKRWQPPLGAVTILFGSVGLLLSAMTEFELAGLVAAAVWGGAAGDLLIHLLKPAPERRWAYRMVGALTPVCYWSVHFLVLWLGYGIAWAPGLWMGAVAWAGLSGLLLSALMVPAPVPLAAWTRSGLAAARRIAPAPVPRGTRSRAPGGEAAPRRRSAGPPPPASHPAPAGEPYRTRAARERVGAF